MPSFLIAHRQNTEERNAGAQETSHLCLPAEFGDTVGAMEGLSEGFDDSFIEGEYEGKVEGLAEGVVDGFIVGDEEDVGWSTVPHNSHSGPEVHNQKHKYRYN